MYKSAVNDSVLSLLVKSGKVKKVKENTLHSGQMECCYSIVKEK